MMPTNEIGCTPTNGSFSVIDFRSDLSVIFDGTHRYYIACLIKWTIIEIFIDE